MWNKSTAYGEVIPCHTMLLFAGSIRDDVSMAESSENSPRQPKENKTSHIIETLNLHIIQCLLRDCC